MAHWRFWQKQGSWPNAKRYLSSSGISHASIPSISERTKHPRLEWPYFRAHTRERWSEYPPQVCDVRYGFAAASCQTWMHDVRKVNLGGPIEVWPSRCFASDLGKLSCSCPCHCKAISLFRTINQIFNTYRDAAFLPGHQKPPGERREKGELWTGHGINRYLGWRRAERILRSAAPTANSTN